MITIDHSVNTKLLVHRGVLEYIAGFSAKKTWKVRGIKRNHQSICNLDQQRMVKLKDIANEPGFQNKLKDFIEESLELFNGIINENQRIISQYIGNKKFYFVIGCGRTGGTYIMKEISRALGYPMKDLLPSIIHDGLPYFNFFMEGLTTSNLGWGNMELGNIGWRKPENYYNLLFQLVQFLVYIKRELGDIKYIVKKKDWFCLSLNLLDQVFGKRANYIVTVRHPAAITASSLKKKQALGYKADELAKRKQILKLWEVLYAETVRDRIPKGKLYPVLFGPEMDEFLYKFFAEHNFSGEPEGVKITPRDYDYEYWQQEEIIDRMERVAKFWEAHGLEFPMPKQII